MTDQQIDDLLATCFEGGSNYWIAKKVYPVNKDYKGREFASEVVSAGGVLEIVELVSDDETKLHLLDRAKLEEGFRKYLESKGFLCQEELFFENYDASDADNVLQFSLFGELVYG